MKKLFTKQNTLCLILAVTFAGWLFVPFNVLFVDWSYQKSIYWGSAKVTTIVQHPFSINPQDSELRLLDFYRFHQNDDTFEFPSFFYRLAQENNENSFSIELTSPHVSHYDSEDAFVFFTFSFGYNNEFKSITISNRDGFPTVVKCHYGRLVGGCQSWNPSQDWSEFLIEG